MPEGGGVCVCVINGLEVGVTYNLDEIMVHLKLKVILC